MPFNVLSELRILVFDTNAVARTAMIEHLRDLGVSRIRETGDPLEAIEIVRAGPIDLIVAEWHLQLVRFLRAMPNSSVSRLPIIVMVGTHHRGADLREALDAGVNEFVSTPVDPPRLLNALLGAMEPRTSFVRTGGYSGPDRRGREPSMESGAQPEPPHEVGQNWGLTPEEISVLLRG